MLSKKLSKVRDSVIRCVRESSPIDVQLKELKLLQARALSQLESDLFNDILIKNFQYINTHYSDIARKESLWIKQRLKTFWLSHADDDLKYLYNSIRDRRHTNLIKEIHMNGNIISDSNLIGEVFCDFYSTLFN